jgi:abortive infection bacteriophage resistance protein
VEDAMEYTESALTVDRQAEVLFSKGLQADKDELSLALSNVSYHRLSGYWYPFRQVLTEDDGSWVFRPATRFSDIWDRYVFDRQLRLLVFDAIERIEVAIRNDLILTLAVEQGPFGYLDERNMPNLRTIDNSGEVVVTHAKLLSHLRSLCKRELRNGNVTVSAFVNKYGENHGEYLPYWILLEIVEFGTLCTLLRGAPTTIKKRIAHRYGLKATTVLTSWMGFLRAVRNGSAHHLRFWNIRHTVKPIIPKRNNSIWHEPVDMESVKDTAFGTLTILKYLLGYIAPQSGWAERLEALFAAHPGIDRKLMGYPANWRESPIWGEGWAVRE